MVRVQTHGLNDWQKDKLRTTVGHDARRAQLTFTNDPVVNDIVFDFSVQPRAFHGTRHRYPWSRRVIYDACRSFERSQKTS